MINFDLRPELSINGLMALGLPIELDSKNTTVRIKISDVELNKFEITESNPLEEFSNTYSILELNFKNPLKDLDSPFGHFTTFQSEEVIFGYFEHNFLPSKGYEIVEVVHFIL